MRDTALNAGRRRVGVVGGGWAGLAAAVEAARRGHEVTLFEMAPRLGGRARAVETGGLRLDNGQHILIGAYVDTLRLLRIVGVDVDASFHRTPLRIDYPDGNGLTLGSGSPIIAFGLAVLRRHGWSTAERLGLLAAAANWALRRFRCDPSLDVAALTQSLPARVRRELIDPLCVAALNTPSSDASAQVFLRVMSDALFAGRGSADLLLPRIDLSALLPDPASHWLDRAGARIRLTHRVERLAREGTGWRLDGDAFDHVVLAGTPSESARLAQDAAPGWAHRASVLRYEPIVTVYLRGEGLRLAAPMLALREDADSPAQFVFDRGRLGGPQGLLAFVISGAQRWVDRGLQATCDAVQRQALDVFGFAASETPVTLVEKRATFRCTPGLSRPPRQVAPGLTAAGDYIDGPYPATLEGAVRSGFAAVADVC